MPDLKQKSFYWDRIEGAKIEGKYDMPVLQPVHNVTPHDLIPFHMVKNEPNKSQKWFHFYEDDFQFERIWNRPSAYLSMLGSCEAGFGTDFSMLLTMPKGQQIWNCWRNRVITYFLQNNGITTVPNVGWSDLESINWAFDGIPSNSVLAITTQGCMSKDYVSKQSLLNGLHELCRQKSPESLIVYGHFPEAWKDRFPMPITVFPSFAEQKWRGK